MKKLFIGIILFFSLFVSIQANPPLKDNDSIINATLALINQDSIRSHIQALQDMGTRFMIAPNRKFVAEWIKNKFLSYGIDSVRIDSCTIYINVNDGNLHFDTTTWQYNVIATIVGSEEPNNTSIICAHYDNVVLYGTPFVNVPGADDNATGVASLFETARVLNLTNYVPKRNIELIAFGAEELMYFGTSGSKCYADQAYASGKQIEMVINNDAIGYYGGNWKVTILGKTGFETLPDYISQIRSQFTSLSENKVILPSFIGTDCQPFFDNGYSAVFICENSDNTAIHTNGDTIGLVDMNFCKEIIKMSCAAVMYSDMSVGIHSKLKKEASLRVYPNPAQDFLYIRTDHNLQSLYYTITDLQGITVAKGFLQNNSNMIGIQNLAKGFYIIQLTDSNQIMVSKFVKE